VFRDFYKNIIKITIYIYIKITSLYASTDNFGPIEIKKYDKILFIFVLLNDFSLSNSSIEIGSASGSLI
jgi:hypothetical protein